MKLELIEKLVELALADEHSDQLEEMVPNTLEYFGVGRYCVVRTFSAGVHLGTVRERSGREAVLSGARRLHSWRGAFTLSAVALKGVGFGSRLSDPVGEILLTEVIEVLPCTPDATKILTEMASHEIT